MNPQVVEKVLRTCMGWVEGETIGIVTDPGMGDLAEHFESVARRLGAETILLRMTERQAHGEEPPFAVSHMLKSVDIALLLTTKSLSHTHARINATRTGTRIASMPGVDGTRINRLLDIDYDKLTALVEQLQERIAGTSKVHITTPLGTDLTFELGDRNVLPDTGLFLRPGVFGNLPAGEVCMAPIEGTANGKLVIDGSMATLGPLNTPLEFEIQDGKIVNASHSGLLETLDARGEAARMIGEFGIGLNPHARICGNVLEDEKVAGTAHIAFGNNLVFGGTIDVPIHLDGVLLDPVIELDGTVLDFEPLEVTIAGTEDEDEGLKELIDTVDGTNAFRLLFENTNDALYIMDLESGRFILVNPAFEKLTGYTLTELRDGDIDSSKLIARESESIYQQKREKRHQVDRERYDLFILNRNNLKIPAEISVQRTQLMGRKVVIGSAHDLTNRKKLESELKKKILEIGLTNTRLNLLTEKIQQVPPLIPQFLDVADEADLFEQVAQTLCARPGLGYAGVNLYLTRDDHIELARSTEGSTGVRYALDGDKPIQRIARGEVMIQFAGDRILHPLKGRESVLGVMEVHLDNREINALAENNVALQGYLDLIETLSHILGLTIENLRLYEKVRAQSLRDQLTNVFNRRYFDRKMFEETRRAMRYQRDLSLLICDLDNLKVVNDSLGHQSGDALILGVATQLENLTREVDIVARYGGDEFCIILPETTLDGAVAKAEKLREKLEQAELEPAHDGEPPLRTSISIGVASLHSPAKGHDIDLMAQADAALYASKRAGKNTVTSAIDVFGEGEAVDGSKYETAVIRKRTRPTK